MTTINDTTTVSTTWWTSSGPTDSTHWLPPADGYIEIKIDEALALSLNGFQALQLLFYLTGDAAINLESLPTTADNPIAWENDEGRTVIRLKTVDVAINEEAGERLAGLLERLLNDSPFYCESGENDFNWKREGF